jgi:ABC-type uncharacterized transport system substrate-binding protein
MRSTARHLLPGLLLIAASAGVLLLSDLGSRRRALESAALAKTAAATAANPKKVALLQYASNAVMDDTRKGFLDGMASRGWKDGDKLRVQTQIAEGDLPTANQIARQMVNGGNDLVASISTVCLQALASADRDGRVPLVFCAVSDPIAAGVGIRTLDTTDKPAHLTGYGTAQPVEDIFREALKANPKLKTVGVVWNPAEVNSEVCTKRARAICQELGLTLLEAPVEGSKDVREAADSLVARGAEAFWTGGDATLINAYDILQQVADKAHIPIFSNISGHAQRGALFDLGANYYQVGFAAGQLAGDILNGTSPATMPVHNLVPRRLGLNEKTRASLRDTWTFSAEEIAHAGYIVDNNGTVREIVPITVALETIAPATVKPAAPAPSVDNRPVLPPPGGKLPWRIQIVVYLETPPAEEALAGLQEGLQKSGLVEGRDYIVRKRSAQGEMPMLNQLFEAAAAEGADLYITVSTPTLQAAVRKVKDKPVVFTMASDPVGAGAGTSFEKHLPFLTGISTLAPAPDMAEIIKTYFPKLRRLGTLFCPAEVNSVKTLEYWQEKAKAAGLTIEPVAANSIGELPDAARALAGKNIDAIVQIPDNLSASGFAAIAQAARARGLPLFTFQTPMIDQGAMLSVSMDYHQAGYDTAVMAARVMRGDNPDNIPISFPSKKNFVINLRNARDQGVDIPAALQQRADKVIK